jgi:hypothetical protein
MVTEEYIQQTVSKAEESFQDCWDKLISLKDAATVFSFQPALLTTLYQIGAAYQKVCNKERELIGKKSEFDKKQFSEKMQTLARYKAVLNQVFDIGKVLGDAFAWLFYYNERQLLKKHYDHEPIPHLALGIGGRGEYEFFKNSPRFGKYFVLAHSITTFLRQGDVSLIDPKEMKVAAIGELKSKKISETEISVSVNFIGEKLSQEMLPKISEPKGEPIKLSDQFPQQLVERFKRQIKQIQEGFKPKTSERPPEKMEIQLLETGLNELFNGSSIGKWGNIKVDRGLLLVGIKSEKMPLYAQLKGETLMEENSFKQNLETMKEPLFEILDRQLPNNSAIPSWILYPTNGRYVLPFGMKPFVWWPLDAALRKAIIFQKFRVMTIYNPAFLIDELKRNGFDVQFEKDGKMKIIKAIGEKRYEFLGMDYFFGAIRTQFFSDASIVSFIRLAYEKMEAENFKQPTRVNLDFDFFHD